jgi:ribonuclease BN (tRNA processing enzyme)
MTAVQAPGQVTVTFAGSGDAFGSGGRFQACIHLRGPGGAAPVLLDCGATSLTALRRCGLDPGEVAAVFVSHLHADHFAGIPFFILNAQFARRASPLAVIGPRGTGRRLTELMEAMFPGSASVSRRFAVQVTELEPGESAAAAGVAVSAFAADHPSGAGSPPLSLRLTTGGTAIGYTGDTAWTGALPAVADRTDLLIAEAYYRSKKIPYHLRVDDLAEHREELTSRRIVLTHMSDDVLEHLDDVDFETVSDGLVLRV